MEYQNKLSRLRHAFLKLQGQDLKQILLRDAAKRSEHIAENVYTAEEIFHELKSGIYKATNELSMAESFELASDVESLSILKKELIEDPLREYQWEETLFVLLEGVPKEERRLLEPVLKNQYGYYLNMVQNSGYATYDIGNFYKMFIPIVRRIYGDFTARHLVAVQPIDGPVGKIFSLEYKQLDEETGKYVEIEPASLSDDIGTERKLTLEVVSNIVEAGSRKLQAGWCIESMQDLNAYHGLDIESEMIQALSAEITQEINNEIIADLKAIAGESTIVSLTGDEDNQLMQLSIKINQLANDIARETRRGAGNYMVVSLELATTLSESKSKKIVFAKAHHESGYMADIMQVGTLNGCIKVYTSFAMKTDEVLIGYKGGSGETDAGYVYCPYVPLMSTGVVVDPKTFQPVVSFMTRYGKFTKNNVKGYYKTIKIESDIFKSP